MILNFYFFRHAESEYNAEGQKIGGQSNNLTLSKRGIEQAEALGRRLLQERMVLDEIYSSTAVRAINTAEIVARLIGYPIERIATVPELLELSQGDWEGKVRAEIYTPEVLAEMKRLSWDFRAPRGESQRDVEHRVSRWVGNNLIAHQRQDINAGLFGHGHATKCFLRWVMNSDPSLTYKIEIDNCSITNLKYFRIYLDYSPTFMWIITKRLENSQDK